MNLIKLFEELIYLQLKKNYVTLLREIGVNILSQILWSNQTNIMV